VNLIGEYHDAADPPARRAGGYLDGGEDVGRAVVTGQCRVAHGPGDGHWRLAVVPCVTTTPAAPELTDARISLASSMTSAISSEAPGTCRTSWTVTSVPVRASPGTAASSCSPLSAGTAPALPPGSRFIAIVPPREKTSTRLDAGRAVVTACLPSLDTGKPWERASQPNASRCRATIATADLAAVRQRQFGHVLM
jgi:hypothetical protein